MNDEVGFGDTKVRKLITGEIKEAMELLQEAQAVIGDDVLSDFEEEFTVSCLAKIFRDGMRFDLSEPRKTVLEAIRKKLEREGIIDAPLSIGPGAERPR